MIVSKSPSIAECVKLIGSPIVIGIRDARDFCLLGNMKCVISVSHSKYFVQAAGVFFEHRFWMFLKDAVNEEDVAPPRCDGELFFIWHNLETACFNGKFGREWNLDHLVVFCFLFGGSPIFTKGLLLRQANEQ